MRERPILMSGPLVVEILADRKVQTRRPVKRLGDLGDPEFWEPKRPGAWDYWHPDLNDTIEIASPYGEPGDRLWVKETVCLLDPEHYAEIGLSREHLSDRYGTPRRNGCAYRAETTAEGEAIRKEYGYRWTPSIHMPRWASRLLLEVREVRVERLQAIIEEDARAEGVADRAAFEAKWREIYGAESWDANPWVWVITFRRASAPASLENGDSHRRLAASEQQPSAQAYEQPNVTRGPSGMRPHAVPHVVSPSRGPQAHHSNAEPRASTVESHPLPCIRR
jgi:hypothetical protein